MEYRQLGRSGLKVSALTLGTMTFGGDGKFSKVGSLDEAGSCRMVDLCLDAGVNFYDTADVYSAGMSEEFLGAALKGRREKVLIATKARFRMGPGPNDAGSSRHHLIEGCEASLRRLGTDHIDLYQLHEWDGQTPVEETAAALDHLVSSGKVRYVGVSNFSGWHLMKLLGVAERNGFPRPIAQQIHYTLQAREAEYELIPIAVDQGVDLLVWSPLAGGLLSGKYRRDRRSVEGTRRFNQWSEPPVRDEEALWKIVDTLVGVAEARGVTAAEVALAWTLTRPGVASVIVGARNEEQLRVNLRAADLRLTAEEIAALEKVGRPPLLYPYWHQLWTASDRLSAADLALIGPHAAER